MRKKNMFMKLSNLLFALVLVLILLSPKVGAASISLVNGGFENGNLNGWSVAGSSYQVLNSWGGYTAPYGKYFALLSGDTEISQSFNAAAGDTLSGKAFFKAGDYMPFNDYGKILIVQNNQVLYYKDINQVGNYGSSPWADFSYTFALTGTYTIKAMVHNVLDYVNPSSIGLDLNTVSDTTAPVTSDNAPKNWVNKDVTVNLTASDIGSGVAATYYTVDGGAQQTGTTIPLTTEGIHTLTYWSVDNAGNIEAKHTATVKIDKTAPVTSDNAPTSWVNTDVTVNLTASDSGSGVAATNYTVDDGAQQTGTTVAVTTEGIHTLAYWSVDNAGNIEAKHTATVKIDKTAPVTSDNAPISWVNTDVTVNLTASDSGSGVAATNYIVDGGLPQTGTTVAVTTEGIHTLDYWSVDIAGNIEAKHTATFKIDKTAPVTSDNAPTSWVNTNITVNLTASDSGSGVAGTIYTVDGGAQQKGTTVALTTEGIHTLTYWSIDIAGNIEAKHTATVKIDKTAPTITGATDRAANANGWYNADVKVTFTCTDPLSGGVASGVASCSAPTTLYEGKGQSVTGNAADVAGNTASATVSGINIDKTAPVTTAAPDRAANSNGWYKADVTITLAATDNLSGVSKTEYNLDGAGWTAYTTPVAISAEGIHTIQYRSTDKADNTEAANSLTIRIDKTSPEAYLQFDPVSHDIQLFGRDAMSGLANPGSIAPVSVTPILGDDHGQQGGKKGDQKGDKKGNQKVDDNSSAESRTYLVKDLADNTLQLVVQVQKEGHDIKARVVSLQYNGGTVIAPLQDVLSWNWAVAKDGSLKVLEQHMSLVDGSIRSAVEAHYDARKNVTWIVRSQPEDQSDDNKNQKYHDDGENPGAVKLPGLVLLRLTSSQGHLLIEVPGL